MRYHTHNGHYLTPEMLIFRMEVIQHAGEALRRSLDTRLGEAQDDLILDRDNSDNDNYRNGDQIRAQICADVIDELRVEIQEQYEKRAVDLKKQRGE